MCGRRSIDDWLALFPALDSRFEVAPRAVMDAMGLLRERQPLFRESGGAHAASLVDETGHPVGTFEDIGRHNAVDKVVGSFLLRTEMPPARSMLLVSGRASFEIVQKAVAARIPVVASVSAASSLAVDLAARAGVTLFGFVRGERATRY